MTRPATPDIHIRDAARALLDVTARCWGMAAGAPATRPPGATARRRTDGRLNRIGAPAPQADAALAAWPYWPAYPGQAASWR
jgi:hypothetical protein